MKNHICNMTIKLKKGSEVCLAFDVVQDRPYPDIEKGGSWKWRNAHGLFREYGREANGIGETYLCSLLRSDLNERKREFNRKDYAGYKGAPGTFAIRGHDMGEISICIEPHYAKVRVRGFDVPTVGENDFVKNAIVPQLRSYIEAHKEELLAEAVDGIEKTFAERIAEMREEAGRLEKEAAQAMLNMRESK